MGGSKMGETTGIEWTGATWNPWRGCTRVSPGCAHCYMFREQRRYGRDPTNVVRAADVTFNAPLRWKTPKKVFTCSWSDFFHEAADPWRPEAWAIIRSTPHLTYQILTKRPERIASHLPPDWDDNGYPNVWLGVSGENVEWVEKRAELIAPIPAKVKFLSAEPWLDSRTDIDPRDRDTALGIFDWVILGGESGPRARPFDLDSARSVRDACARLEIPFFLKQLGGPSGAKGDHEEAVLDGRTWKEMPT